MHLAARLSSICPDLERVARFEAAVRDGLLEAVSAMPRLGVNSQPGCDCRPLVSAGEDLASFAPLHRRDVLR